MNIASRWLLVGALLGGLAVAMGAFGAHGLQSRLADADGTLSNVAERRLANWETAARYQMYHALALLAIGCLARDYSRRSLHAAGSLLTGGTFIFSGCLYALVLTEQRILGAIVPMGGVLLVIGWALLAYAVAAPKRIKAVQVDGR